MYQKFPWTLYFSDKSPTLFTRTVKKIAQVRVQTQKIQKIKTTIQKHYRTLYVVLAVR